MNRINPIDFGELLEEMGYVVQDDTGEVYFIPHWKCFNSLQDYCEAFPDNQECLMYDV